jgi:hypothetical protein
MRSAKPVARVVETVEADATALSNSHRRAIVGLPFTASMINYVDRATISFALPLIFKDLALGPMTKGKLLSAFSGPMP